MILPILKTYHCGARACHVPAHITVSCAGAFSDFGAQAFCRLYGIAEISENGFVRFVYDETLEEKAEIYQISIAEDCVEIRFRDLRGAVNGAASAVLLLKQKRVACGTVTDYPDCSYRSVMIDMARGVPDLDEVGRVIHYMALAKYNHLHLHLIDSKGPCYRSAVLPEYKAPDGRAQCEMEDLRKIADLCKAFAIELVPEIEVPAHATAFCTAYPQFMCQVENAHKWTACTGNDAIWNCYEALLGEIAEIFPESKYIHIGSDELEFLDLPGDKKRICHWDACPRCTALRRREGLADRQAQFYYVIDKLHGMVKSLGKQMVMWNDQIDVSKDVPLSREILIQFWRVAAPGRGPHDGCSMAKFIEKGFQVINSYYPYTYVDVEGYTNAEKLKTWTPVNTPELPEQYLENVVGGELCAWEFGNYAQYPFYGHVMPPALAIFADKLWHFGDREYTKEYMDALTLFVFGFVCENDIFSCFGAPIPPRKKDVISYVDPCQLSCEWIRSCIGELDKQKHGFFAETADIYIRLLQRMLAEAQADGRTQ